eukprot:66576_1
MPLKPALIGVDAIRGFASSTGTTGQEWLSCLGSLLPVVFCGVAFVLGLLLCCVAKKFMRIIISLLTGLSVTLCVWCIFVTLHDHYSAYSVQSAALIIVTCAVSGFVASVISFRWRVVKFTIGIACGLGCGFMFYFLFHEFVSWKLDLQWTHTLSPKTDELCGIGCAIFGGIIGFLFGIYRSRNTMKLVGALFGSFLVVSSIGFFLDEYCNLAHRTNFNLAELYGMVVHRSNVPVPGTPRGGNPVKMAMRISWVILCGFSIVYQCCVQQKAQTTRRRKTRVFAV